MHKKYDYANCIIAGSKKLQLERQTRIVFVNNKTRTKHAEEKKKYHELVIKICR